jgi:membrane-bound lytic murein transglycosylase MltF
MKFLLVLFLSCLQNNKLIPIKNISNTFQSKKNDYKYDGFDHRYNKNETDNEKVTLHKIYKHFQNKNLLDILKNENISLVTKILILNDNSIKKYDIFAGGLMKDFDFEF